jgi:PIN domain nuclease of toxin-antitoxin system
VLLVLDTHVWVWAVSGDTRRLGRRSRTLLTRAESQHALRISTATIFEVAALHTSGRLRLGRSLEQWIDEALARPALRVSPVPAAVAIDAGTIPRTALPDPLDRVLVATARHLDATLVTSDRTILDYASSTRNVRVHDGSA